MSQTINYVGGLTRRELFQQIEKIGSPVPYAGWKHQMGARHIFIALGVIAILSATILLPWYFHMSPHNFTITSTLFAATAGPIAGIVLAIAISLLLKQKFHLNAKLSKEECEKEITKSKTILEKDSSVIEKRVKDLDNNQKKIQQLEQIIQDNNVSEVSLFN